MITIYKYKLKEKKQEKEKKENVEEVKGCEEVEFKNLIENKKSKENIKIKAKNVNNIENKKIQIDKTKNQSISMIKRNSILHNKSLDIISNLNKNKVTLIGEIIKLKSKKRNFKLTSTKSKLNFLMNDNLINDNMYKDNKIDSSKECLPNITNNKMRKINLTKAILKRTVKEEDFSVFLKKEKEKEQKLYLNLNWKYHSSGGKQRNNKFYGSLFKSKEYLLKEEGFYTLNYFESFTKRKKEFNENSIKIQDFKKKLCLNDIYSLIELDIISGYRNIFKND